MAPGAASFSRKQLDELAEQAKGLGARGLYTIKVTAEGASSALEKTLGAAAVQNIVAATGAKAGDLIVAVSAAEQIPGTDAAALIAGQLRLAMAERLNLIPKNRWEFLWLTGFPLFEWSSSEKRWAPAQHPFTGHPRGGRGQAGVRAAGGALEGLRPGAERLGAWLGQHPDSQPGAAGARVRAFGIERRAAAAALRLFPGRADLWDAAARRNRAGPRPRGDAAGGRKVHSRSDRLPQDDGGAGFDGGVAGGSGSRAAGGVGDRSRSGRGSEGAGQPGASFSGFGFGIGKQNVAHTHIAGSHSQPHRRGRGGGAAGVGGEGAARKRAGRRARGRCASKWNPAASA